MRQSRSSSVAMEHMVDEVRVIFSVKWEILHVRF